MFLYNNANIMTMENNLNFANGFVITQTSISGGKILAAGDGNGINELESLCDDNGIDISICQVIDCKGNTITPGFIDPHCHIGLWEDGQRDEDGDGNEESDPITPHLRAIDAINPFDPCFKEAISGGITSVMTGPGSANVIGGQFAFIKTYGVNIDKMIVKSPAAMKVAFGENPKGVYGKRNVSPASRMGTAAILREALFKAKIYKQDKERAMLDDAKIDQNSGVNSKKDMPDYDMKHEALFDVLDGLLPLKIHAHRSDDMITAIRICKEFNLKFTLDHCTEGYKIVECLIEEFKNSSLAGLIIGPIISERSKPELANLSVQNPKVLSDAGILTAIMTDHPVIPIQYLPLCGALAAKEGMDEYLALAALTINAAKLCGVDSRVGSIRPGKDADIVILSGNPFDYKTKVCATIINGDMVYDARN